MVNKRKQLSIIFVILVIVIAFGFEYASSYINDNQETISIEQTELKYFDSTDSAIEELNKLEIVEDGDGSTYSGEVRENQYGDWKTIKGWSTRDEVLDLTDQDSVKSDTAFESGTWHIAYTGKDLVLDSKKEVSSKLQIDHLIPIGYVARHGGSNWDEDKSQEYYNDYGFDTEWTKGSNDSFDYDNAPGGVLIVSDSSSNASKSDRGPSKWLPSNKGYWREYCERWIIISRTYDLSIDREDYITILNILESEA